MLAAVALLSGAENYPLVERALKLQSEGKLGDARNLLLEAASGYRAASDGGNLAHVQGIAADISVSLGLYQDAIAEASEALKFRVSGRDGAAIAEDYNIIGLSYQYLGDYPNALLNYRHTLENDRARGDAEGEVTTLNNIGNIYYFQGSYSEALREYEAAMAKTRAAGTHAWTAARRDLTLANLAVLYQRIGQETRALSYYRDLASARAEMPAHERAQLLLNQGVLYRRLGDPVKALEFYRAAQKLFAGDRHRDGEIGALRNIGIVYAMNLNDRKRALAAFHDALELARESSNGRAIAQVSLYRAEILRMEHRSEEAAADFRSALQFAKQNGLREEEWKCWFGLGRLAAAAGETNDAVEDYQRAVAIIESVRATLRVPALRTDFLADKRDVYDALIEVKLRDATATPAAIFEWMERSRARTAADRSVVALPLLDLSEVQRRMPEDTQLVEFWVGEVSAAAVWITRGSAGIVRLGDAAEVRNESAALARTIPQSGNDWSDAAMRLGHLLLRALPETRRVIVAPDDVLGQVPFEALGLPKSNRMLIERSDVSYLPGARFLSGAQGAGKWMPPWATQIVAIANPSAGSGALDETMEPLPGAVEEVEEIARLLPGRARIHSGDDARKDYLGNLSPPVPLLHVAAHAIIDPENPELSRILLAHGPLFQREVYGLDLRGVDLVTLSACDTARGKFVRGEGIDAFSSAFLTAGASATLTTLWRVADRPTAAFMEQFYYGLARGDSKEGALRTAKLRFIGAKSNLREPRYWAAFVLNGNGAQPVRRAISLTTALLVLTLFAVAIFLTAWWRRRQTA